MPGAVLELSSAVRCPESSSDLAAPQTMEGLSVSSPVKRCHRQTAQTGWLHKERGQRWEVENSSKTGPSLDLESFASSLFLKDDAQCCFFCLQNFNCLPLFKLFFAVYLFGTGCVRCDVISHGSFVKLNLPLCGPAYGSAVSTLI